MRRIITLGIVLVFAFSCKTTEELQREQMVDNLSIQLTQNQKLSAEAKIKLQELESRLNSINGALEEQGHKVDKTYSSHMKQNKDKIQLLEEIYKSAQNVQDKQAAQIDKLEKEVTAQKKYIKDVLKILKKVDNVVEDQKQRSPYNQAFYLYNKGRYTKSKPLLLSLLKNKKIKGKKQARVLNALGMMNFWKKKDDQAVVYFSKLFTEHPKAPYTTNALVYMAKSFYRQKKKDQAIAALNMLLQKYPKSKKIPTAKKLLRKYR